MKNIDNLCAYASLMPKNWSAFNKITFIVCLKVFMVMNFENHNMYNKVVPI